MIRKVLANSIWLVLAEVINRGFSLILTIFVARIYGAEIYGQFIFALSFITFFQFLADFGLGVLTIRDLSRNKNKAFEFVSTVFSTRIVTSIIALLGVAVVGYFTVPEEMSKALVYLAGTNLVFTSLGSLFTNVFVAFEKMKYNVVTRFVQAVVLTSLGLAFIFSGSSIVFIMVAYIISNAVAFFSSVVITWKKITKFSLLNYDFALVKPMIFESWPFGVIGLLSAIYYSIDSVMLGYFGFTKEVGWYGAVYRIIILFFILRSFFYNSLYPQISQNIFSNKGVLTNLISKFQKFFVVLSIPLGVGITILASRVMEIAFGDEFLGGTIALQILIWSVVVSNLNLVQPIVVSANKQQKLSMVIMASGAVLNVLLNLVLIPKYTITGAAIATVVTNVSNIILITYFANKIVRTTYFFNFLPKVIIGSVVMGLFLVVFYSLNIVVLVPLAAGVYLLTTLAIGVYEKKEIAFIREILLRKS